MHSSTGAGLTALAFLSAPAWSLERFGDASGTRLTAGFAGLEIVLAAVVCTNIQQQQTVCCSIPIAVHSRQQQSKEPLVQPKSDQ